MNDSRFQTSLMKGVAAAASVHVNGKTLGNGEAQQHIKDLLNFKQMKGKLVRPFTNIGQCLHKKPIHMNMIFFI